MLTKTKNLTMKTDNDEFNRGKVIIEGGDRKLEISEDYEHLSSSIEYLIENELFAPNPNSEHQFSKDYQNLQDMMNSVYVVGCNCTNSADCSLVDSNCFHGGSYIASETPDFKELVLNPGRKNKDLIYECFDACKCSKFCKNRLLQYGPRKSLQIVDSTRIKNQKSLMTTKPIPCNGFICEYIGEILTKDEAERRYNGIMMLNNKNSANTSYNNQMNYIICLNEHCIINLNPKKVTSQVQQQNVTIENSKCSLSEDSSYDSVGISKYVVKNTSQTFIDPSKKGNIGRYLNHSCEPNCYILSVRVNGPIPKLGIFAKRNIQNYEELCFHYAEGYNNIQSCSNSDENDELNTKSNDVINRRRPCHCGSKNCEKFLPNVKF